MLDRFIREYNLATTMTAKDIYEWCNMLNKDEEQSIDYSDSICFFDIVSTFNELSKSFYEDFRKLPPLEVGSHYEVDHYSEFEMDGHKYRILYIYVEKPNKELVDAEDTILMVCEDNGVVKCQVSNNINPFDKGYYRKEVTLDEAQTKSFLDLFSKHRTFYECYKKLKNEFIFGNGTTVLFSKIEGDLSKSLDRFVISFGNAFFDSEDYVEIPIELGEKLKVIYDESKVRIRNEDYEVTKDLIDKLLRECFVNKSRLEPIDVKKESGVKLVLKNEKKK